MPRRVVVIHGVGDPPPGKVIADTREGIARGGVVTEIDWNEGVFRPFDVETFRVAIDAVTHLMRSMVNSAHIGFTSPRGDYSGFRGPVLTLHNWLSVALEWLTTVAYLVPVTALALGPTLLILAIFGVGKRMILGLLITSLALVIAAAGVGVVLLGFSLLACVWHRSLVPLAVTIRRVGLLFMRLAVTGLLLLVLNPSGDEEDRAQQGRLVGAANWVLSVLVVFTVVAIWWWMPPLLDEGIGIPSWLTARNYAIGVAVVIACCAVVAAGAIRVPAVKMVLDITRYVGDLEYRNAIQETVRSGLRDELARVSDGRDEVVIAAHSLGSVLALDALIQLTQEMSPPGGGGARLTLVTLGSPLARFFRRFFPYVYGADLDGVVAALRLTWPSFQWVNVYRPLDYVGGRLRVEGVQNTSTGQRLRLHKDYWSDERVAEAIGEALTAPVPSLPAGVPCRPVWDETRFPTNRYEVSAPGERLKDKITSGLIATMMIGAIAASAFVVSDRELLVEDLRSELAQLDVTTEANVYAGRSLEEFEGTIFRNWQVWIQFEGEDQWRHQSANPLGLPTFHVDGLAKHVEANGTHFDAEPWMLDYGTWDLPDGVYLLEGITVRYDPAEPARFDVPDWPPSTAFWDRMQHRFAWGATAAIAVLVLFPLLPTWLTTGPGRIMLMVSGRVVQDHSALDPTLHS